MHHKKIICIAVDDEPPALDVLKNYIASVPNLYLTGTCTNALDALTMMQDHVVDLLFLDIQMPKLYGTDLIRTLKNPPKVIFTTAYRKFAVEGFELDAVDYLLKPISFERFLKAVNKVMNTNLPAPEANEPITKGEDAFIILRADRTSIKVLLDDIVYIESIRDYIKVVTITKTIVTKQAISSIEEILPVQQFIRIHRSFIVAINKIQSYTNGMLCVAKKELPISRMYRYEVGKILKKY